MLAPVAVLLSADEATNIADRPQSPMHLGDSVSSLAWAATPNSPFPAVVVQAQYAPALILSHDCELEKDFNERVRQLMDQGESEEVAIDRAEADPSLDPLAVIAPLLPYTEFAERLHPGIRSGQRIGVFPIDQLPGDGGNYVVDLFRPVTVSVRLLPMAGKVGSLARQEVFDLRYKLSEAYASRDLAVITEIEAIIGRTILRIEALPKGAKKTALVLHLDDGDSVHLEIRRPRDELPREITRKS